MTARSDLWRRVALAAAAAAACWAVFVLLAGGFDWRLGPLTLSSHAVTPPALISLAALAAAAAFRGSWTDALARLRADLEAAAPFVAIGVAVVAFGAAMRWNTFAAGGSDSHCYLSQAALFASGRTAAAVPLALEAPWPHPTLTLAPTGYVPSPVHPATIVPICPAGLSLLMAGAAWLAGDIGPHVVVPALGSAAILMAFLLARRLYDATAGAVAAVLVASSPIFLYQAVQPMTDVPAAALWLGAGVLASNRRPRAAFAAGIVCGLALMMRPNLLPLAVLIGVLVAVGDRAPSVTSRGDWTRSAAMFAAGLAPALATIAILQARMYGAPWRSGYGSLSLLFAWGHVLPNAARYFEWTTASHTPWLIAGLAAPCMARHRGAALAGVLLVAATLGVYLPYVVFDDWWYIRFLLPAIAWLLTMAAVVTVWLSDRLPTVLRAPTLIAFVALLASWSVGEADRRAAFRLQALERPFRDAGAAARHLPRNAVVVTLRHSGSVRYYSGRPTVTWDTLDPPWLDGAVNFLTASGRPAFLLLEASEEPAFRTRFAGHSALASLDWPPRYQVGSMIRIYDPSDRRRYRAGRRVRTVRIWPDLP
jgi:hypothetical protein